MSDNATTPSGALASGPRQVLLVGLCTLGLVLAAFAIPPATGGPSPPSLSPLDQQNCVVSLDGESVPGTQVTVTVRRDGRPVEDVPVWFNGDPVGRTDASGQVTGRVPYVERLRVTVGLEDGDSCQFVTDAVSDDSDDRTGRATEADDRARIALSSPMPFRSLGPLLAAGSGPSNETGTFPTSPIDVAIRGQADPGSTVTVLATLAGEPVPNASVAVDGQSVGRTDAGGRKPIEIPDDGTRRLTVTVSKGELRTSQAITVRLMTATVRGGGSLPLPGEQATVVARIDSSPVEGAVVQLAGDRVGTTGPFGTARFTLPADPTATVTVTTGDRTARTSLLATFAPTLLAVATGLLVLVLGPLVTYWAAGRRGIAALGASSLTLAAAGIGYVVDGTSGALIAVLLVGILEAVALVVYRPTAVTGASAVVTSRSEAFVERVIAGVLWLTRNVERTIDQLRRAATAGLSRIRVAGVRPDLSTLASAIDSLWTWIRRSPARIARALSVILPTVRRQIGRLRTTEEATGTERPNGPPSGTTETPGSTLREMWREFARQVAPDRWRRRTPGEVARRAIDAGFPHEPVRRLTGEFRDVEYGDRPLSAERYRRVLAASAELTDVSSHDDVENAPERAGSSRAGPSEDDARTGDDDGEVSGS